TADFPSISRLGFVSIAMSDAKRTVAFTSSNLPMIRRGCSVTVSTVELRTKRVFGHLLAKVVCTCGEVQGCYLNILMSQHPGEAVDVAAPFEHECCERVT